MRDSAITANWRQNSRIELRDADPDRRSIRVVDGPGLVLVASRKTGGRPFTYDTASVEEVFVELARMPQATETWQALEWSNLGFQRGNIAVGFLSVSGSGGVRIRKSVKLIGRLLGRRRSEVQLRLRFSQAVIDSAKIGEVDVHWTFDVDI